MKKVLIGLGVLVVLLVIVAFAVPALIPTDTYKTRLLAAIHDATGRDARIDGDFGFSILPNVEFTAGKVSLANAKGRQPANMVALDKLKVRVAVLPLLSGKVQIDSFVLDKPVISLSVDKAGVPNWQFAKMETGAAPAAKQAAPTPTAKSEAGGGAPSMLKGLTLGDVRIVDGKVSYADARTGKDYVIDNVNMKVALPSLSSPMEVDGSLVWNKEKIVLSLHADDPNALLNGKASPITSTVASNPVKLAFKGSLANGAVMKAHGTVDLDVPSVRKLAAWTGSPLNAPGSGFGPLKVSGTVDMDGKKLAFTDAKLAFDAIKGTGAVRYDGGGARPYVNAKLAVENLDLNPYLPPEGASGGAENKPAAGAPAGKTAPAPAAEAGWSDKPLDVSVLKQADADLDFTLGGLVMRKIKIGKSHLAAKLAGGNLTANLTEMALYGGKGTAKVTANGAGKVPQVGLAFDISGVQANPLLADAIGLERLEGTGNASLDVKGAGASERAIVSALDGQGKIQFLNGAIRGINLAAMVRNVKSAFLNPEADKTQKTDFSELAGTYVIRNGILTNNDLEMKSPLLRIAGKGTVNLPARTVNYRVEPKLVASTSGQGGQSGLSGLMVPVMVTGPWNHLSYQPDLAAAVSGAVKGKALEELQKVVPGGGKGLIPGVGGSSGGSSSSGGGGSSPVPDVGKTLKGLFGK